MAGEEVFQLVNATWGVHEFLCSHPRNSRLVHAHGFSNVVQHQGFHRLIAVVEETTLMFDDLCGNLHQGFVTALQDTARAIAGELGQKHPIDIR